MNPVPDLGSFRKAVMLHEMKRELAEHSVVLRLQVGELAEDDFAFLGVRVAFIQFRQAPAEETVVAAKLAIHPLVLADLRPDQLRERENLLMLAIEDEPVQLFQHASACACEEPVHFGANFRKTRIVRPAKIAIGL